MVLAQSNRDQCGVLVLEKELVTSSNVRRSCASTEDCHGMPVWSEMVFCHDGVPAAGEEKKTENMWTIYLQKMQTQGSGGNPFSTDPCLITATLTCVDHQH